MIDASAIVAVLARRPGWEALLDRLDASRPPHMTTPVALLDAIEGLARAKAPDGIATPKLLASARDAVAEFAVALGLREVPVTADLGRRAASMLADRRSSAGRSLSKAAAQAYRTDLLAVDDP